MSWSNDKRYKHAWLLVSSAPCYCRFVHRTIQKSMFIKVKSSTNLDSWKDPGVASCLYFVNCLCFRPALADWKGAHSSLWCPVHTLYSTFSLGDGWMIFFSLKLSLCVWLTASSLSVNTGFMKCVHKCRLIQQLWNKSSSRTVILLSYQCSTLWLFWRMLVVMLMICIALHNRAFLLFFYYYCIKDMDEIKKKKNTYTQAHLEA